jgi:hypothetical protein
MSSETGRVDTGVPEEWTFQIEKKYIASAAGAQAQLYAYLLTRLEQVDPT